MKYKWMFTGCLVAALFLYFTSCQQSGGTPPVISFYVGANYIFSDTTLTHGTIATFGINAYKAGTDQLLRKCLIQKSTNGGPDSTIQEMNIITQAFSQFYGYTVGDSGSIERYTFIIVQDNGLSDSASTTITAK